MLRRSGRAAQKARPSDGMGTHWLRGVPAPVLLALRTGFVSIGAVKARPAHDAAVWA